MNTLLLWLVFNLGVLALLALDLGLFNRRPHSITMKEAAVWSSVWIILALLFNAGLFLWRGPEAALEFFTAYILEKSLSADNLFVFSLIFSYAQVPAPYQHKVLY